MKKYYSSDEVEAAQWTPEDTEPVRELLTKLGSKLKAVSLSQPVPVVNLDKENALVPTSVLLTLKSSFSTASVIAQPTDYVVFDEPNKLKAIRQEVFEKEYTLKPTPTDTTALRAVITTAQETASNAIVSEDGADIDFTQTWYLQEAVDSLTDAIQAAQAIADKEGVTPEEVETAIADLENALDIFLTSGETGLKTPDKSSLKDAIVAAKTLLMGAIVSVDGTDIEPTQKWYTQEDVDSFTTAVDDAQAIVDKADATEEEVTQAAVDLADAKALFEAAGAFGTKEPEVPVVDKGALSQSIAVAENIVADIVISADGTNVEPTVRWVTQEAFDEFSPVLQDAKDMMTNEEATQEQVDAAKVLLDNAASALAKSAQFGTLTPPPIDRKALEILLNEAVELLANAVVSEDGSDVETTQIWHTQEDVDALSDAKDAAQAVYDDEDATQEEVDAAETALEDAIDMFEAADQAGTKEPPVDKTVLSALVVSTTELMKDVNISDDGTDILVGETWYTQEALDDFLTAINEAQLVIDDVQATQEQVDEAVTKLAAAQTAFEGAVKDGTLDKSALEAVITAATALAGNLKVSVDGADVPKEEMWYTQENIDTFNEAIEAAQTVLDKKGVKQAEVDQAVTDLSTAQSALAETAQPGTKPVDKTALNALITSTTALKDAARISVDGSEVDPSEVWYAQEAVDTFAEAIKAAQAVADDEDATDTTVAQAITNLANAQTAFTDSAQNGTYSVDKTALTALIEAATELASNAIVSTDGADVHPDDTWYTQDAVDALNDAIEAAQSVIDYDKSTQDDVTNAVTELSTAQQTFTDSGAAGTKVVPDTTELKSAIEASETLISKAVVSEDGSNISMDHKWYAQTDVDTYREAIDAAKAVVANREATEEEIAQAVTDLDTATTTFTDAAKQGTQAPGLGDGEEEL